MVLLIIMHPALRNHGHASSSKLIYHANTLQQMPCPLFEECSKRLHALSHLYVPDNTDRHIAPGFIE
jgi:hypothetical protein